MIADKLMKFMADKNAKGSDERLGNMSLSDVPYCPRKTSFKLFGTEPTNRPKPGAMEVGTAFHAVLQDWAKQVFGEKFHSVEKEVVIPVDYHDPRTERMERAFIKGHCDGVLDSPLVDGEKHVIDFKTYRGVAWKYRTPLKPNYSDQLQLYMHALECKSGIIVHVCKDDFGMDESLVEYDPGLVEFLIGKMSDILGAATPEEFVKTPTFDWECRYCPYMDLCKPKKAKRCKTKS